MTITAIAIPAGVIQVAAVPVDYQWRGNWNQTTQYLVNDKVFRGASSWRAVVPNLNDDPGANSPTGNWVLLALGVDNSVLNAAAAAAATSASQASASAASAAASATLAALQISGAAGYAAQSSASAATSAASATQSQTAAGASSTSAAAAAGSASAVAASATAAAGSATSAATSATLAANWASQTSGVVSGGMYSAYYYAQQAQASAVAAAAGGVTPSGTFVPGHLVTTTTSAGTVIVDSGIDPAILTSRAVALSLALGSSF